jgi:hypothetical protein
MVAVESPDEKSPQTVWRIAISCNMPCEIPLYRESNLGFETRNRIPDPEEPAPERSWRAVFARDEGRTTFSLRGCFCFLRTPAGFSQ